MNCCDNLSRKYEIVFVCFICRMENFNDIRSVVNVKERVGRMFCVELIISEDENGITGNIEITGSDENCLLCKVFEVLTFHFQV